MCRPRGTYTFPMHLTALDWVVIAITLVVCFAPSLFFGKRAGKNTSEFFASGRTVPWWLAGLSMVATTFSSDTPNLVTDIVRRNGVAGNWVWWAFVLTGVATVFFFARLWRRSGVLTDLEFYELRYSGTAASVVRGFRAVYLGLFFNCFIMGMVMPRHARLSEEMTEQLAGIEKEIHKLAGREFNIASPKQMRAVLFDELKLPRQRRIRAGCRRASPLL